MDLKKLGWSLEPVCNPLIPYLSDSGLLVFSGSMLALWCMWRSIRYSFRFLFSPFLVRVSWFYFLLTDFFDEQGNSIHIYIHTQIKNKTHKMTRTKKPKTKTRPTPMSDPTLRSWRWVEDLYWILFPPQYHPRRLDPHLEEKNLSHHHSYPNDWKSLLLDWKEKKKTPHPFTFRNPRPRAVPLTNFNKWTKGLPSFPHSIRTTLIDLKK